MHSWSYSLSLELQQFRALTDAGDFRDLKAKVSVNNDDFAARDQTSCDKQFSGLVDHLVEFHNGAGHKPENIAKQHFVAAKANSGLELDVEKQIEIGSRGSGGRFRQ